MSFYRIGVQNYLRASEALLKANELDELSDDEIQAIAKMLYRLSEKVLDVGNDGKP